MTDEKEKEKIEYMKILQARHKKGGKEALQLWEYFLLGTLEKIYGQTN